MQVTTGIQIHENTGGQGSTTFVNYPMNEEPRHRQFLVGVHRRSLMFFISKKKEREEKLSFDLSEITGETKK